ncbi:transcription initiation factor TFIID subunit 4-like isoform X2 [Centruroides sculpturatus]|uniref:transcription initiation factor TFIID subunit 4-like isoform X2 n=1 Tax=Centruroides sculpturatus TaxID=218467 RepID=UPI000C6E0D60|nr:transcription initiation factor TFIID subunit 4-like isoform X2 [Centruroides sculpturatus]
MASAKSLEEMLSSVVDERAVNAFVRSLDSQLSTNIQLSHQDITTSINNQIAKQANIITTDDLKHGSIERSTMTTNNSQTFCDSSLTTSSVSDNVIVTLANALPASGYMSQVGPSPPIQPSLVKNITPMEVNPDTKLVYAPLTNVTQLHTQVSTENRTVIQRNTAHTVSNGNIVSRQPSTVVSVPSISKTMNQLNTINTQSPIGSNTILVPHSMLLTTDSQQPLNGSIKDIVSETKGQNSLPQTILTSYGKQGANNSLCNQNLTTIIKGSSPQISVKNESIPQSHIGAATVSVANIVHSQQPTKHVMSQVSASNMLSGVQLINMCAGNAGTITTQKSSAPRVVFSNPVRIAAAPQVIAARPRAPIQNTITLPQGLIRSTLLVRTENGQLQVVNVAPGITAAGGIAGTPTYRLESVQPGVHPNVSSSILQTNQPIQNVTSILPSTNIPSQNIKKPTNASNLNQQLTIQTNTANGQVTSSSQMSPTTAKKKCKNFLSTLLRLANGQAGQVAKNVEKLIQGIIDDTIQPEEFSHQLQKELNSSPQPYLIPFLKKNLPYLRHSMMTGELSIEGIKPPPPGSVVLPIPQPVLKQVINKQVLQMKPPITQMRVVSPALISGNLSAQLTTPATQTIVGQRLVTPKLQGGTSIKTIAGSKSLTGILNQTTKPVISSRSSVSVNSKERERDKKSFTTSLRDDDDINDVAAMGGVNLIEESQRILATTAEIVGTQIRSCKDETFFSSGLLQKRISKIAAKHGVDDVSSDVIALVSHAAQERLKSIIEKLGTIAAHYVENPKLNSKYEITSNVKDQLAFLEEVDRFKMSNTEEMDISNGDLINEENPRLSKEEDKRKEDKRQTETILSALGSRKRSRTDFQSDQVYFSIYLK